MERGKFGCCARKKPNFCLRQKKLVLCLQCRQKTEPSASSLILSKPPQSPGQVVFRSFERLNHASSQAFRNKDAQKPFRKLRFRDQSLPFLFLPFLPRPGFGSWKTCIWSSVGICECIAKTSPKLQPSHRALGIAID